MLTPTYGERLLVQRRRMDETQLEAARRLGVSTYRYRRLERSLRRPAGAPVATVRVLAAYERFRLTRRRAGMSLAECAERAGVSQWWLTQMEHGDQPADRLEAFWATEQRSPELVG